MYPDIGQVVTYSLGLFRKREVAREIHLLEPKAADDSQ